MTVFATVIAITKDLPDVEGDRKYNIETFATRVGVRGVAFLGAALSTRLTYATRCFCPNRGGLMLACNSMDYCILIYLWPTAW